VVGRTSVNFDSAIDAHGKGVARAYRFDFDALKMPPAQRSCKFVCERNPARRRFVLKAENSDAPARELAHIKRATAWMHVAWRATAAPDAANNLHGGDRRFEIVDRTRACGVD